MHISAEIVITIFHIQ